MTKMTSVAWKQTTALDGEDAAGDWKISYAANGFSAEIMK